MLSDSYSKDQSKQVEAPPGETVAKKLVRYQPL